MESRPMAVTSFSSDYFWEDPASTSGHVLMCWKLGLQRRSCKGDTLQSFNRPSQFSSPPNRCPESVSSIPPGRAPRDSDWSCVGLAWGEIACLRYRAVCVISA